MYRKRRRRRRSRRPIRIRLKRMLGRGFTRPYVDKRNRLMLGSGSLKRTVKQKGGLFPLATALAAAPPIIDFLAKIIR